MKISFLTILLFIILIVTVFINISKCESQPLNYKSWKDKRVLFIGAHPDDIVGTTGGLVGLLSQQGTNVSFVIVTNGDKGCSSSICKDWTSEKIAAERYHEAINSAAVVGVPESRVHLLDFEDGMVTSYPEVEIRQLLVHYIRSIKPHVLMTWYPYPDFQMKPSNGWDDLGFHPDHQAVGRLTLAANFDAGVGRLLPEAGKEWHPSEFYMWSFIDSEYYVSLTEANIEVQINAYLKHVTQYPNKESVHKFISDLGRKVASTVNTSKNITFAEGFLSFF